MFDFFGQFDHIEWLGIFGSLAIAGAYFSVSNNLVDPEKPTFHVINLIGSIFILISLYYKPNAGAILIEVLWVFIASISLLKFFYRKFNNNIL